jgi:2-methylfumaryl-CoA isomerase
VLPAWDLFTGATAAYSLLAAERYRRATGQGQEVRIPLADVGMATLGHLGQIAEVLATGADRPRVGNDIFGAFGRDFLTADGRRVMVIAITPRQWTGLLKALDIAAPVATIEAELGVSFARDEGIRFIHRHRLYPLVEAGIAKLTLAEIGPLFDAHDICWGPYRTVHEAVTSEPRLTDNPIFTPVEHPSGHRYPTPGPAPNFTLFPRGAAPCSPRLGEHTEEVLASLLGLSSGEIGRLHDQGIVAGPRE